MKAVVSASAHVAPHGTRTKRFAAAAESFSSHPQATTETDGKHLRDCFFLLKDKFEYDDKKEAAQTGNEGAVTKLDELLIDVVEKFNDFEERERAAKGENTRREKKLVARGAAIRHATMTRLRDRQAVAGSAPSADGGVSSAREGSAAGASGAQARHSSGTRHDVEDLNSDEDVLATIAKDECLRLEAQAKLVQVAVGILEKQRVERAALLSLMDSLARSTRCPSPPHGFSCQKARVAVFWFLFLLTVYCVVACYRLRCVRSSACLSSRLVIPR